mmetsp:Transcript_2935/g.11200  ORF Transcript_2935/g.11200 Transcript_2935/m.11200 type:complete len:394 (-) Transcript_2935:950-2131(-)
MTTTNTLLRNARILDCSFGESGGQILRNSTSICCLLRNTPLILENIRKKRSKPGLRKQHASGLQLIANYGNLQLKGCEVGSERVELLPVNQMDNPWNNHGVLSADTQTAGSCTLMAQSILPCLLFGGGGQVDLKGGTNVPFSPPVDFLQHVFHPLTKRLLPDLPDWRMQVKSRGFFPKGGGHLFLDVDARVNAGTKSVRPVNGFSLTKRGAIKEIHIRVYVSSRSKEMKHQLVHALRNEAQSEMREYLAKTSQQNKNVSVILTDNMTDDERIRASGEFAQIMFIVETENSLLGFTQVHEKNIKNCNPGKMVKANMKEMEECLKFDNACVDEHMQDQLIIFMALCKGQSVLRCGPLSSHTETAIFFMQELTGAKFSTTEEDEGTMLVECEGIGF